MPGRRPSLFRRPSTRRLGLESLEPRLALSADQGLVAVGSQPAGTLAGKIVYTSAGHGWQWSDVLNRYATDRGNLLSLVEDFGNQDQFTFYVDYLFRAGATVVPMRPVGRQPNEVVLDNDSADVVWNGSWLTSTSGTRWYDEDYGAVADSARYRYATVSSSGETATASYAPTIPAAGFYPVYAWASASSNRTDQLYRVNHTGGSTQVRIDHRKVGNGWVYLGTYHFAAGRSPADGSVTISNYSTGGGSVVIADAIRFGNGMGDVPSGPNGIGTGSVSGYPREDENSLHWLWRAVGKGTTITTPADIIATSNVSAPARMAEDMNVDTNPYGTSVYVGFHSNATTGDPATATGRGALGLVSSTNPTPNQTALATALGRQINVDMRALDGQFEYTWSTRTTYSLAGDYGEISNLRAGGEFDSTIIEVAFHDNTPDNALLRDARARDQIARSTYEGTLEHLIAYPGTTTAPANVTLPSPPAQVAVTCTADGTATISWVPGSSSANGTSGVYGSPATGFRVYGSTDGRGFDGGTVAAGGSTRSLTITGLDPTKPYQFRVAATNAGGESLPSEVVSVLPAVGPRQVLIVNGFDRIDKSQNFKLTYLSSSTTERVWARYGNSRDYTGPVHAAIQAARPGVRVDSASNEAVIQGAVSLAAYDAVVWILGTESTANRTFDATEQSLVESFVAGGGHLFASGAEVGWDLDSQNNGRTFFRTTLGAAYSADDAGTYQVTAAAGGIFAGLSGFAFSNGSSYTGLDGQTYNVAYPDVLTAQAGSAVALSYSGGTGGAAAVQRTGTSGRGNVVVAGFPFETITQEATRSAVMGRVLGYFAVVPDVPLTVAAGQTATDAVTRAGDLRLVKRGAGRLILDRSNTFTGGTVIEQGELVVRNLLALGTGGVEVRAGARLTIDCGFSRVGLPALTLASGGRIDVGTGGILLAAGAATPAAVRQQLVAGRGSGDWASTTSGIGSTAAGQGTNRCVGMLVQADGSILVCFAAPGDLNLDGLVDTSDLAGLLGSGLFDTGLAAGWADGDANYDGVVDSLDLSELLAAGLFDQGPYRG
ncbi:MAG: fibronectin type III domain-containing protein [Planctomycetaceae bacterium]